VRRGFNNVTMRQIAQEIGVSTGALYHYFPTKLDVLEQLFSWAVEENIEAYSDTADQDLPLNEKVARFAAFWASSGTFYEHLLLLALDLFRNSAAEGEEVLTDFAEHYRVAISKSLGTSERVSEVILTYLLGFVAQSLLMPRRFSFTEQALVLPDVLNALITSRKGEFVGPATAPRSRSSADAENLPPANEETDA
jgi:AcrR family transcriptional regulator